VQPAHCSRFCRKTSKRRPPLLAQAAVALRFEERWRRNPDRLPTITQPIAMSVLTGPARLLNFADRQAQKLGDSSSLRKWCCSQRV
jgi:hypothetical protein